MRSLAAEAIKELGELDEYDESRVKPELLSWFDISREAFLRRLEEIKNIKADRARATTARLALPPMEVVGKSRGARP